MKNLFKEYLFEKHILVNDLLVKDENGFYALFTLASKLGIEITKGKELSHIALVEFATEMLGEYVPESFYRGYPETVRNLTKEQKTFDQLLHYFITYGLGDFSEPGHSVFEEDFERIAFREGYVKKKFEIVTEEDAEKQIKEIALDLLKSSRPLSKQQYELVKEAIATYELDTAEIGSLDTTVKLIYDLKRVELAKKIKLSDIIKLTEYINYSAYGIASIKRLNLKNTDRKLIASCIKEIFENGKCDIIACFEKKSLWCGLLHHLHYKPNSKEEELFLKEMRGKENKSVYSQLEKLISKQDIKGAIKLLKKSKGSGALLRNLDYIASRCENEEDVRFLLENIEEGSPVLLIQMLMHYGFYKKNPRTFVFAKNGMIKSHDETEHEAEKRKTFLCEETRNTVCIAIKEKLKKALSCKAGKVFIDEAMKKVALPMQESTSNGGFGVLSKGTRLPLDTSRVVRAFTYWSKVNDIDLSCIAINEEGKITNEFSWRTSRTFNPEYILFSGDQTSGYNGGSEYFDVDVNAFRKANPDAKYLVFCDNVFSGEYFSRVECRAGYMIREKQGSGEVYEPKTVRSSFKIDCDSVYAYLFAIDFEKSELVWLNVANDSNFIVAAYEKAKKLLPFIKSTEIISVYDFAEMIASEVVSDYTEADIVFSDKEYELKESASQIHSYDFEKILALMN